MSDLVKIAVLLPYFAVGIPAIFLLLKGRPRLQRWAVLALCLSSIEGILHAQNWSLTLGVETVEAAAPRSHTKGFHFFFFTVVAVGLSLARRAEDPKRFTWLPPGLGLYLLYCVASLTSLYSALRSDLVWMAAHKHFIVMWWGIAIYNWINTSAHLVHFVRCVAAVTAWEAFTCLKMKYIDGRYQVFGTFEHQNSLGMYGVMVGGVLLASAFAPKTRPPMRGLAGLIAAAICVQATVSRASMASFALCVVTIVGVTLLRQRSKRTIGLAGALAGVGMLGLAMTADTIVERFHDQGNKSSGDLRDTMIVSAKMMLDDHPTGVGWNNFALAANYPYKYAEPFYAFTRDLGHSVNRLQQSPVIESHYYLLLSETGYLGLLTWLLVIGWTVFAAIRAFFRYRYSLQGMLGLGIGTGMLLNYVQSLLERVLSQPRNLMMWIMLVAVLAALPKTWRADAQRRRATARKREKPPRSARAASPSDVPSGPALPSGG